MLAAPADIGRGVKTSQMDSVGLGMLNGGSMDTSPVERKDTIKELNRDQENQKER